MARFTADSTRQTIFIIQSVKSFFFVWTITFTLLQLTTVTKSSIVPSSGHHYHHETQPARWTKTSQNSRQGRPVDVMTDVINDLGVKILDRYLDNTGNVAFSPSGLGFVLVALYEGSAGSSSSEISEVLGLPRDRRVTRIGLRDIHRRLRSYLNADAFLGGLTLNREDINLRPDYEDILRFYGFDISDSGMDNNNTTIQEVSTNDTDATITTTTTTTTVLSTIADPIDTTTVQSTTMIPNSMVTTVLNDAVEVITNLTGGTNSAMSAGTDGTLSTSPATLTTLPRTIAATIMNTINSTDSPAMTPISTETTTQTTTTKTTTTTTATTSTSTISSPLSSTESSTTLANVQIASSIVDNSSMIMQRLVGMATESAETQTQSSSDKTNATLTNPTITATIDDPTKMPITTILMSPVVTSTMITTTRNFDENDGNLTTTKMENSTNNIVEDTATNTVRKRRGILHGPGGYFSSSPDDGIWLDEFGRLNNHDDYPSQDEDIGIDPRRPTEIAFLVNGCDYSRVTAATYTAFLPFSYFPSLRASLLEFPLDDPRYKILVALPGDENGTRRLARIMTTKPITLRHLRRSLQSTWVTAVIPSFMLRGFVTLTPYLQRLGISDVFDPRAADLTPMSPDLGVYARDIQQSIGVNIRNNVKGGIGGADGGDEEQKRQTRQRDDLIRSVRGVHGIPPFFLAGGAISPRSHGNPHYPSYPGTGSPLYARAPPVPFVVDRPFLYFIIDDETSATLLAGRIDDPLNSRML